MIRAERLLFSGRLSIGENPVKGRMPPVPLHVHMISLTLAVDVSLS